MDAYSRWKLAWGRCHTIWLIVCLAMTGISRSAMGQHNLPVPGCPSRGLVAPGSQDAPFLVRSYGCALDSPWSSGGDAEEAESLFLLPQAFHQYQGITAEYIYTGEVFTNARGGINTNGATRYRGNLDLVLNVDTTAMDLWKNGRFFIYGSAFHGRTLTADDVGDWQLYSNIDSSPRPKDVFQVTEFWYEHAFADGDLTVKIGKQDANADFGYVDLGGDFVNSSFGIIPTIPLPTWPNPSLGVSVRAELTDLLQVKAGAYDGSPTFGVNTGGKWGGSTLGENGIMTLYELSLTPQLGKDGELPGTYRAGAWYHSEDFDNLATGTGTISGNYGFYTNLDQLLWIEPGSDEEPQGLGAFFQFGWCPADRNLLDRYYGAGLTYRGVFGGRDQDMLGAGIAIATFSDPAMSSENVFEIFYKAQLCEWAVLQPDIQHISNPGGNGRDALVIGLRTEMVF